MSRPKINYNTLQDIVISNNYNGSYYISICVIDDTAENTKSIVYKTKDKDKILNDVKQYLENMK